MILMIAVSQAASRIPFDDQPQLVQRARIAYVATQLLSIALFYFCSLKIKAKNDTTILKYVEPKSPISQEPGELITTTNRDYDLMEIHKSVRSIILGMMFVALLHLYWGFSQPLLIQSVLPIKAALESREVKIWFWGRQATGNLKRPFKLGPGLFGMQAAQGPQTDKASIKEAEEAIAKKKE